MPTPLSVGIFLMTISSLWSESIWAVNRIVSVSPSALCYCNEVSERNGDICLVFLRLGLRHFCFRDVTESLG